MLENKRLVMGDRRLEKFDVKRSMFHENCCTISL